jgi:predicted O-methyltransferase YrrM
MDLNDQQNLSQPASHYEKLIVNLAEHDLVEQVKRNAFGAMDQLEGWCSKNKASLLVDLVFMLKPKTIVEIGVWGGKSLVPMAYALKVTESGVIYGIDPWSNTASADGMDGVNYDWWSTVDHMYILRHLRMKIMEFGLEDQIELIRATSEFATPIHDIDILHVDGNHSEKAAMQDVNKWVPLVRKGGIIIFDDVTWATSTASNSAAVKWLDEHCLRLVEFHEHCDWAIWIKL